MDSSDRRTKVLDLLKSNKGPITGTDLAERFGVSRQVIVQDIAVLRAAGENIIATPRGYMAHFGNNASCVTKPLVCMHNSLEEIEDELTTIVDYGGKVLDVIIEHPIYGEKRGLLMISSRQDVKDFMELLSNVDAQPLSYLTGGIHLHTIEAKDERTFERIRKALDSKGYLVKE